MDKTLQCEFFVGGAGVAGICAAIQAGRLGMKTILVEKEMMLGGNAGPNLGVGASGSMHQNPYWNETGIIEEIEERVSYRRARIFPTHAGFNTDPEWDTVVSEMLDEAGVLVLRRHIFLEVLVEEALIKKIIVLNIENLDKVVIDIKGYVLDSTGDAYIAAKAGAEIMMGRESKEQTGERSALEKADEIISSASLTAITVDTGIDTPFIPPLGTPVWNPDKPANTFSPEQRVNYLFQVDEGGDNIENHVLYSPEALYLNLVKRIYSIWDYFKNVLYPERAATHKLMWISPFLGKRESRRIKGDYLLTQTDIEGCKTFYDAVGFGGAFLDEHPPSKDGGYETRFYSRPLPYDIPFGCIYSNNINNLFSGGRAIGVSHLAFTTTRFMRTGGVLGQSAAVAAKLCLEKELHPRMLRQKYMKELQQAILKQDVWIIGINNSDVCDLAKGADIKASSEAILNRKPIKGQWKYAGEGIGVNLFHYPKEIKATSFYLRNTSEHEKEVIFLTGYGETPPVTLIEICDRGDKPYEFHYPERQDVINTYEIYESKCFTIQPGYEGWFEVKYDKPYTFPSYRRNVFGQAVFLAVKGDIEVFVSLREEEVIEGVFYKSGWMTTENLVPAFAIEPDPIPGKASNIVDGYIHREGMAHLHQWMSSMSEGLPQWIELNLKGGERFNKIQLRFDTTNKYWSEMYFLKGELTAGRCVADYRVEIEEDGIWKNIITEKSNYRRFREHCLNTSVEASKVRLIIDKVWDEGQPARVYELRLYNE